MPMFHVVATRSGPSWMDGRPLEEQTGWADHSETHLRIQSIDPWTIRLDGRSG